MWQGIAAYNIAADLAYLDVVFVVVGDLDLNISAFERALVLLDMCQRSVAVWDVCVGDLVYSMYITD